MTEKEEETVTITQTEMTNFIEQLRESLTSAITENNAQAMVGLMDAAFPPIMERLEQVAQAQIILAQAVRTNRRDNAAMEFAKLFIERALRTPEGLDRNAIMAIPAEAYALADEMDVHGRVAEMQSQSKGEQMDAAAKESVGKSPRTAVAEFFGRKPIAEAPKIKRPDKKKN